MLISGTTANTMNLCCEHKNTNIYTLNDCKTGGGIIKLYNYEKKSVFLSLCFIALTFGATAQLKVNSTGKVVIGIDPDATYNLNMNSAIFKSGFTYPNLIISADPTNAPYGRAILPSANNTCKLGYSGQAFNGIWTYSLTNLSDGRQKENIKEIKNALGIVMKLKGVKRFGENNYLPGG